MSWKKSAAERRAELELKAKREAWEADLRARGIRVMGRQERDALYDVMWMLALACRRFADPFMERELQQQIQAVYKAVKEKYDKSAAYTDFAGEAPPDDGKAIYMPKPS